MAETRDEQEKLYGTALYWQRELDQASEFERDWRERGIRVVERYRDERDTGVVGPLTHRFNILWANTETLKSALFARMAQPDVRRRFHDGDTSARQVAIVLERALHYGIDVYDSELPIRAALEDYLLPGRGVVWVIYEPIIVKEKTKIEIKGEDVDILEEEEIERLGDQRCRFEYVHWQDYRESPSRRPEDVTWRARRHLFTREELVGRGFDHAEDVPLNWMPERADDADIDEIYNRAEVWEIWDKVKRRRLYVATGYKDVLADDDDPYNATRGGVDETYDPEIASKQFGRATHGITVSLDSIVYLADRTNNRVQSFSADGTFLKEVFIDRHSRGFGSAFDVALSSDPEQRFLYVADGMNSRVVVVRRDTMEVVSRFGHGGPYPGGMYALHSLATDSQGNLYTGETLHGRRVQRWIYKGLGPMGDTGE